MDIAVDHREVTIKHPRGQLDRNPRLVRGISILTAQDLPPFSSGPHGRHTDPYRAIRDAGYEAVQTLEPERAIAAGLIPTGFGRIAEEASGIDNLVRQHRDRGCDCTTLQLGTGFESDAEMDRFADAVLAAAKAHAHPVFVETHRATITQDIRRTIDLVDRFPDLRFNGDFANWYIGHELHYGDIDAKMEAMQPVLARTRFMHLRLSSSAFGQLPPDDTAPLEFYRTAWAAAFRGFFDDDSAGDCFPVHPELLPPRTGYPRMIATADGRSTDESDRWADALQLIEIALDCFHAAMPERSR